jgi:hypothetical protein
VYRKATDRNMQQQGEGQPSGPPPPYPDDPNPPPPKTPLAAPVKRKVRIPAPSSTFGRLTLHRKSW